MTDWSDGNECGKEESLSVEDYNVAVGLKQVTIEKKLSKETSGVKYH